MLSVTLVNSKSTKLPIAWSYKVPKPYKRNAINWDSIHIPFCEKNENKSKEFSKNFQHFTKAKYCISINWITKKVKSLFPLKVIYPACKICQ